MGAAVSPIESGSSPTPKAGPRRGLARLLREPLVHFLVLGALLFVGRELLRDGSTDERTIVITRATVAHLERELAAELGRAPSPAELDQALARYRLEEIAYREALRLGLDLSDPAVRTRLVTRVREIYQKLEIPKEPSRAELDAFLAEHRQLYELPARFAFEHAFVARSNADAAERVEAVREALARGAPAATLGDAFDQGTRFEGQTFEDIARVFGFPFAVAVRRQAPGTVATIESPHGYHAVRLLEKTPPALPPRATLEPRLIRDYQIAKSGETSDAVLEKLASQYTIVEAFR